MKELDGEVTSCEVISKASTSFPYDAERYFDKDNFYPMDGEVIPMVAASAAQNTGNYFDQDNFYPADGITPEDVQYDSLGSLNDAEFSNAGGIFQNIKDYFSPEERAERKEIRKARKSAKTEEIKSRAELNKSLTQDKPSDVALAEALKQSTKQPSIPTGGKKTLSKNTKTLLIVGGVLVVGGLITFLVLRSKKK